jgi:hypothetical protein
MTEREQLLAERSTLWAHLNILELNQDPEDYTYCRTRIAEIDAQLSAMDKE